jgi:hypothetical protein
MKVQKTTFNSLCLIILIGGIYSTHKALNV